LQDIRQRVTTKAWEAEVSPLLKAVARERLLKTQLAGEKSLADAVMICELWKLAVA
jgi:hypothetical protein